MDAVRFGKALGIGVRATAAAVKGAAEAAAAPNPRPFDPPGVLEPERAGQAGRKVARGVVQSRVAAADLKRGSRRFGEAVWAPAARAGSVLWYELTGTFFALFALAAGVEVWHRHTDFLGVSGARQKAWFAFVMLVAFGWFTTTSFIKAHKRAHKT